MAGPSRLTPAGVGLFCVKHAGFNERAQRQCMRNAMYKQSRLRCPHAGSNGSVLLSLELSLLS
jgi:hypothetical protein